MLRISIPTTQTASQETQPLLVSVQKQLRVVPNLYRLMSLNAEGVLALFKLWERGSYRCRPETVSLWPSLRSIGAITAFQPYRPTPAQAGRGGTKRGGVSVDDVQKVKSAGQSDAEVIEIVFHVALNTLTNYLNRVADTEIDFPVVPAHEAALA